MTEALDPAPADRVLEIGTGSGYQAAVLAGLVAKVYTIGRAASRRWSCWRSAAARSSSARSSVLFVPMTGGAQER